MVSLATSRRGYEAYVALDPGVLEAQRVASAIARLQGDAVASSIALFGSFSDVRLRALCRGTSPLGRRRMAQA